ncbi:l-sorbosone dehydrogenase : L-sorbosone dehydrogenase OS=Cystobacter fuscus DSM 2262 GN=D187_007931 PE=4 SV=1: GSDH [Gemmataceae bacterium]|nr:l-sorbosone dehydrogenase : L-sorbosone dehydrogenase OS=Cystobacter fuscus DSM 2262 GN=D187_007931 PE=4 SV=1: GSDH [Gemmataceae bacterium]VTT98746.1 l-sorbosone dehydrogenase : L-sorbosone dehydrogenase OS=Cystobacter fuscus DSM 2262 GN=D187_007931 PE=4 SV=1: GSDH [Gemmataceae bacterium]
MRALSASFFAALLIGAAIAAEPPQPKLPPPFETKSVVKHPKVIGWPEGKTPAAPPGFTVTLYADGFDSPRWLYFLPNGDLLVAEARTLPKPDAKPKEKEGMEKSKTVTGGSANRVTLLRDADKDGKPEVRELFLTDLNQPLGMALIGDALYVANTDGVVRFPYKPDDTKITVKGVPVLHLPLGGYNNHWTRNLLANADGTKLYVSVGSASNVGEKGMKEEALRANILEINPDGTGLRVFAAGLRNPVGMAWEPTSKALWTAVNERDELGDELVPDYITSVKDGAFYGWPYSYAGKIEDPRRKGERPDLVAKATAPDVPVGAHTASLGLCFYTGEAFPEKYRGGAFVGQRGSWNRSKFAGYRVAFVPFSNGKPTAGPEDFLTGFIANNDEVYGRPVCVCVAPDGALLVSDDASNRIWRVAPVKK